MCVCSAVVWKGSFRKLFTYCIVVVIVSRYTIVSYPKAVWEFYIFGYDINIHQGDAINRDVEVEFTTFEEELGRHRALLCAFDNDT